MSEQAARQIELIHICFIDDSKTSAYVTKKLLKQQGYAVDHFPDAETALESLMENDYDLVITDLMISAGGGVNGDDLIRLIRHSGHPTKSSIPIMVVTGASDSEIFENLIVAGANKVLPKPLDGEILHDAIQDLVSKQGHPDEMEPTPAPDISAQIAEPKKATISRSKQNKKTSIPLKSRKEENKFFDSELQDLDLVEQGKEPISEAALSETSQSEKPANVPGNNLKNQRIKKSRAKKRKSVKVESSPRPSPVAKKEVEIPVLTTVAIAEVDASSSEDASNDAIAKKVDTSVVNEDIESDNTVKVTVEDSQERINKNKNEAIVRNVNSPKLNPSSVGSIKFERVEVKTVDAFDAKPVEEIPQSMLDSIQQEITNIDKQASGRKPPNQPVKPASPEPIPSVPDAVPAQQQSAIQPEIQAAATPPAVPVPVARKTAQADIENNPLLELLEHLEDPNESTDFSEKAKSKKKSSSPKRGNDVSKGVWIFLIVALILPASIFWVLGQRAIDVKVVTVRQGPIHSEISVPGRIVSKRNIKVNARAAGQLMDVLVKEGDKVKKGQTMARMDDKEAKSNVKRAQARLMSIQEEVAASSKTQERLQRALDLGAVSRQIVEDAEAAWKTASAKQSVIEEELIASELKLDRLQIKAPFSGLITSVSVQEGQWVSRSDEILTLVDMDQRVVEIRVDVSDSARLNVGQEVILSSEAFDGESWQEEIVKIGEEAKTEDSANVIKVQTSLGGNAPKLRIGQQIDAEIRVASRNNALLLPHNVLFTHDGASHAAVVENSKIVFIPVATGIESVTQVEVVRGLRPQQEVVIPAGLPLEPGMNAVVTNSKLTSN